MKKFVIIFFTLCYFSAYSNSEFGKRYFYECTIQSTQTGEVYKESFVIEHGDYLYSDMFGGNHPMGTGAVQKSEQSEGNVSIYQSWIDLDKYTITLAKQDENLTGDLLHFSYYEKLEAEGVNTIKSRTGFCTAYRPRLFSHE